MANLTANPDVALDMYETAIASLLVPSITVEDSTHVRLSYDPGFSDFLEVANLKVASEGSIIGGTISRVEERRDGTTAFVADNIAVPIVDLLNRIEGREYLNVFSELFRGSAKVNGSALDDRLVTFSGNDTVRAGRGDDEIEPGAGFNVIDGGDGDDMLVLSGKPDDYSFLNGGTAYFLVSAHGYYQMTNVETVYFVDGSEMETADLGSGLCAFDSLRYIAGYWDLLNAFWIDPEQAATHFARSGFSEGRDPLKFDSLAYIASYGDLRASFGADSSAGISHFIRNGAGEGRMITFSGLDYIASYRDLIEAFGADALAGASHYIRNGEAEGRTTTFNGLNYIASYGDLIETFGENSFAGAAHFISYGVSENRTASFDPTRYAASNIDLAIAFGNEATALATHYIRNGFREGRIVDAGFDEVGYLLSNADLGMAHLGSAGALYHWVVYGAAEGRVGDLRYGREQDSHILHAGTSTDGAFENEGDHDWYEFTASAGQKVEIDYRSTATDLLLAIHRADGSLVANYPTVSTSDHSVAVTFTADANATYYLALSAAIESYTGSYTLDYFLT